MKDTDQIWSGSVPVSLGIPSAICIQIPGTKGLCEEFSPRGHVPKRGSTSTLFFQYETGKRHLRLGCGGYNVKSKTIDFHWNQQRTFHDFGNRQSFCGRIIIYKASKYYKYGEDLVIFGVSVDIVSIFVASNPLRRATEVVSGWGLAWAGCKVMGGVGAFVGSAASTIGTAIGGVGECIIGGFLVTKPAQRLEAWFMIGATRFLPRFQKWRPHEQTRNRLLSLPCRIPLAIGAALPKTGPCSSDWLEPADRHRRYGPARGRASRHCPGADHGGAGGLSVGG